MSAVVEYLQVAPSFVVSCSVADVVPAGSVPDGWPLVRAGGVVSTGGVAMVKEMLKSVGFAFAAASEHRTWYV